MSSKPEYMVVRSRMWMNETSLGTDYLSDLRRFALHADAVRHGFQTTDDFNIAVVRGGDIVDLLWMEKSIGEEPEVMADIARAIGLRA